MCCPHLTTTRCYVHSEIFKHLHAVLSTVSRLASMDQAIHKLNVGHYTLDVKLGQLVDRLSRMDGKTSTQF